MTKPTKKIEELLDDFDSDDDEFLEIWDNYCDNKTLPFDVRKILLNEIKTLQNMNSQSSEYPSAKNHIQWLFDLPWDTKPPKSPTFASAKARLDNSHFGMAKIKERIIEHLAVMKLKGNPRGQIILLSGPPGVGKTSLAKAIAYALGRPFARVSLGGVHDESAIRGHRKAYIGANPGRIIQAIKRAKSRYAVVLLDEIDKIPTSTTNEVSSALLELLDHEQNKTFVDNYINIPYDLSDVFFIATANDVDNIPIPLLDRLEIIELSSYTDEEKIDIALKYLVPSVREEMGLSWGQMKFDQNSIKYLIDKHTMEAGVRSLRREIATIARKVAKDIVQSGPNATLRKHRSIKENDIKLLLGNPKYEDEPNRVLVPGVVAGLAYTELGGVVMYVESSKSKGKGKLILTGNLGLNIKESGQNALSWILANGSKIGIEPSDVTSSNIHINFPDGIAKDGPSAGVAVLCSMVSLFLGKTIPNNIAMTGEITLRGQILEIGGVKDKILAAYRNGKTNVFLPISNASDLSELPVSIKEKMTITPVTTMEELLKLVGLT